MSRLTIQAPAKVNLALAVGAPDASGMHPICSWMVTVDLCDELDVVRLPPGRLSRYAILWHDEARQRREIDWPITRDLAVRAHHALERHVGHALPVQLRLRKRIPIGGGLGGGSTAAAAMLRAVVSLFELDVSPDELARIGAALGSDVTFLVRGGSAIVEGLGERVTHHETLPSLPLVLILPDFPCPTAEVYRRFDDVAAPMLRADAVRMLAGNGSDAAVALTSGALFNDLTAAAMRVAPPLTELLARVTTLTDRTAHLSGSGSTVFVVADDPVHARSMAETLGRELGHPVIAVRATRGEETRHEGT